MMMFKQSMKTKCDHWIAFPALVCILFSFLPAQGQNDLSVDDYIDIQIYPSTVKDVGGYTEVQEVFGMMTGFRNYRVKAYLKKANIQGIRNIINWIPISEEGYDFPSWAEDRPWAKKANYIVGKLGYKYPSWAKGLGPQFESKEISLEWFDRFIQKDPYQLWDDLLPVYENLYGFFNDTYGPVSVTLGPHPSLFDGRLERDMDAARRHFDAYIKTLKSFTPPGGGSKLKYFQLQNEPNQIRFWAAMFNGNQKKAVASYTRVFNGLYDYLKTKYPDVIFLGTCVGHNGAYRINPYDPGYTWEEGFNQDTSIIDWNTWVKYFIDHVDNPQALAYYNCNSYCIPSIRQLANASMTQNYAELNRGVRPRYVITETSAPIKGSRAKVYQNQFIFHANDIFMMLHHPDKFATRHAYMASLNSPGNHSFFTDQKDRGFTAEAPYWVLRTYKNLRGKNIHYESSNDQIRVFATSPGKQKLVIGLLNPTDEVQPVRLDPGVSPDMLAVITRRKAVYDFELGNATYSEQVLKADRLEALQMEPQSAYAIEIDLYQPVNLSHTLKTKEYYGNKVKVPMEESSKVDIHMPYLPDKEDKVWLRIGIDRRKEAGSYGFTFNGEDYKVDWEDTPETTIESWNYMVGYIEIPIESQLISKHNELVLDAIPDNVLLYSSLFIEGLDVH